MLNSPDSWIHIPHPLETVRLHLFCIPYAGAGASIFYSWPACLPADIEVCALQLPGREQRLQEDPAVDLALLIPAMAEALHRHAYRPFALFGHSLGALLAFELARFLREHDAASPIHLFLSGAPAPEQVQPAGLAREVQRLSVADTRQPAELQCILAPILQADLTLLARYQYHHARPLSCPLTIFGGWQDELVDYYTLLPWKNQTDGHFSIQMFSGDHFFLNSARTPLTAAIATRLLTEAHV